MKFKNISNLSPIVFGNQSRVVCMYYTLELKRRLFNFPAPLSDCQVFSLCEN